MLEAVFHALFRTGTAPAGAHARTPLTHVPLSDSPLPELDQRQTPWPGTQERVGDTSLYVRETPGADGTAAVYVHGLGGSSTNWTDLAAQLSPYAAGVAPDLPGFGFSEPPAGYAYSLSAHADVVARFLDERGLSRVHLVGNSMGGAIAVLLAARRPDLVRTLTLISPAMPDRRPDPRRLSDPRLMVAYLPFVGRRMRRQLAAMGPRERAAQVIKLCAADPSSFPEHRLDELADEHAARAGFAWANTAMARSTFEIFRMWFTPGARSLWSVLPTVSVPTLVVWGTHDRVISVRRARRTAELLPSARLLVLPGTGHIAQMERPVSVARAVLGMWEAVDAGAW